MFLCLLYRAKFKFYWFGAQISHKHIQYSTNLLYFFQPVFSWSDVKSKCYKMTIDIFYFYQFSSVQSLSHVWLFAIPWIAAHQASLSTTNTRSLLRLMSIELVMKSNHLILSHPLLLLPSIFPSIRVLSNESALHIRWPKYWSVSFNISPSNEHSGLISFRMNWLDLLAVLTEIAAAAKSLQSCPTLCNPIDGSPPGSSFPGILQARTLEWVAISFYITEIRW